MWNASSKKCGPTNSRRALEIVGAKRIKHNFASRSTELSVTSRVFPKDSECYETSDEIIYHVPPDFNIPVGQEHRHIVIVPGKKSDYKCTCSDDDGPDNEKENRIPDASSANVDDAFLKKRHEAARAYALGLSDKPDSKSISHKNSSSSCSDVMLKEDDFKINEFCLYLQSNRSKGIPDECKKYVCASANTDKYELDCNKALNEVLCFMRKSKEDKFSKLLQYVKGKNDTKEMVFFHIMKTATKLQQRDVLNEVFLCYFLNRKKKNCSTGSNKGCEIHEPSSTRTHIRVILSQLKKFGCHLTFNDFNFDGSFLHAIVQRERDVAKKNCVSSNVLS